MTHLIFTISNHWVQCCDFCCIKDWERNSLLTNTSVQLWSQIQTSRTDLISESNYQKQTQLVEQWGLEEEVTEDEGRFIILFTYFRIKILTNLHSDVQQHWKFQVKKKKKTASEPNILKLKLAIENVFLKCVIIKICLENNETICVWSGSLLTSLSPCGSEETADG